MKQTLFSIALIALTSITGGNGGGKRPPSPTEHCVKTLVDMLSQKQGKITPEEVSALLVQAKSYSIEHHEALACVGDARDKAIKSKLRIE